MTNQYGDWKIEKSIGEGGQAHIFLAKNLNGDFGIIKRLKNVNRIGRFIKEIESIKDDPKGFFPRILEIDIESKKPYFVMEYFPNGVLREEIIKDWSLKEKCKFYMHLILAVAYANLQGVIHRDLKPENILVDEENRPKVSDFGICFIGDDGNRETLTEEAVGSFRYIAPELEDGRSDLIGPHSDVYSLGKIAYWLFSGGKIYNRERHRDDSFNLAKDIDEHWVYFFNDFLDKATHHDVNERIEDCPHLILEFGKVEKSIRKSTRYLDLNNKQECIFCHNGHYKEIANALNPSRSTNIDVSNFGFNPVGSSQWLIMVCDNCGNVQSFRKDHCADWSWIE